MPVNDMLQKPFELAVNKEPDNVSPEPIRCPYCGSVIAELLSLQGKMAIRKRCNRCRRYADIVVSNIFLAENT